MTNRSTEAEVRALFLTAGWNVLAVKPLIDGYGYSPNDERYYKEPPRAGCWRPTEEQRNEDCR